MSIFEIRALASDNASDPALENATVTLLATLNANGEATYELYSTAAEYCQTAAGYVRDSARATRLTNRAGYLWGLSARMPVTRALTDLGDDPDDPMGGGALTPAQAAALAQLLPHIATYNLHAANATAHHEPVSLCRPYGGVGGSGDYGLHADVHAGQRH